MAALGEDIKKFLVALGTGFSTDVSWWCKADTFSA
jgi:hypothetical protein